MQCLVHRKRRVQGMFSASCTLGGKGIEGLSKGSWCQAPVANADAKANKNGSLKQAQMEAHVECTQKPWEASHAKELRIRAIMNTTTRIIIIPER